MRFPLKGLRRIGILVVLLGPLFVASKTWATPLYGGYNGESTAWTEYTVEQVTLPLFNANITFGADTNSNSWTRIRFSVVPFFVYLEFTYDSFDIVSGNFSAFLPWPIRVGSELDFYDEGNDLWWLSTYLIVGIVGMDSADTVWTESGIPGVFGSGKDSHDNLWAWTKELNWLYGFGEDFKEDIENILDLQKPAKIEKEFVPLQNRFTDDYGDRIDMLLKRVTNEKLRVAVRKLLEELSTRVSPYPGVPIGDLRQEFKTLSRPLAEEIFTEEVRNELRVLLDAFAREVKPQLERLNQTANTP